MGTVIGLLLAAALVWVAFTVVMLWQRQERIVFQPPSVIPGAPSRARRVEFLAADGHPLHGYVVGPLSGATPATIVLAFHGNADLSAWLVPWAAALHERTGASVMLPEYRGYGGIPGTPTYLSAQNDARGALAWVRREHPNARVVLFGHSLGSAIASELAREMGGDAAALVLQSPFTSAQAMAARMLFPPLPWLWGAISRVHYDTRAIVRDLTMPVWVSHGTRDIVIPARMGRAVFDAAREKGELLLVGGAGHNDVADVGGGAYWAWLEHAVAGRPAGMH